MLVQQGAGLTKASYVAAVEKIADETLGPILQQLGIEAEPETDPAHSFVAAEQRQEV